MEKETKLPPKPNLSLYFQLQPNVSRLARNARISRPAIYGMVYGERQSRPDTVAKFNAALAALLKERLAMAKKITSRP